MREIFAAKHHQNLPGGLLEGMGRLFMGDVRLAVYPMRNGHQHLVLDDFRPPKSCAPLYQQLKESDRLVPMPSARTAHATPLPDAVLAMIRRGDRAWRRFVPVPVARLIEKHRAFREGSKAQRNAQSQVFALAR